MGLTLSVNNKKLDMAYSDFNDLREAIAHKISKEYGLAFHNARPPICGLMPDCPNINLKPLMECNDSSGYITNGQCWDILLELKELGPIKHIIYDKFYKLLLDTIDTTYGLELS